MYLRIATAFAALVVLGAAAGADFLGGNRGSEASAQTASETLARLRPSRGPVRPANSNPTVAEATTSFRCDHSDGSITTYTLSVTGGACSRGPNGGNCGNVQTNAEVTATCRGGCGDTKGSGSCTQTTTPPR